MSVEPPRASVKGSCRGRLMKHKINKLELQIGLECGDSGGPQARPPGLSPSSHGSASHHPVKAVCDSRGRGVR